MCFEIRAALTVGGQIARPGGRGLARYFSQGFDVCGEALKLWVDDGIWAVGGDDATRPTAVADNLVPAQIIERAFGGRQCLDVERIKQGAGAEGIFGQFRVNMIVIGVSGLSTQSLCQAENMFKRVVQPDA